MGSSPLFESRGNLYRVILGNFSIKEGFNVREDYGDIDEMAKSIAENGQKVPLRVRFEDNKVVVVDGHRRLKAINVANEKYGAEIKTATCVKEEQGTSEEDRCVDLFTCNTGKPLTVIEQAAVVKRLVDYHWSSPDIAKKIGKTSAYINSLLSLNGSSKILRDAVRKGFVCPTAAIKLAAAPKAKQEAVLEKLSIMQEGPAEPQEAKAGKAGAKASKPAKVKKLKVKDVEKATKGSASMVSSKKIRDAIKQVEAIIANGKRVGQWKAVLYGLHIALGQETVNDNWAALA